MTQTGFATDLLHQFHFGSDQITVGTEACLSIRPEQIHLTDTQTSAAMQVVIHNRIFLGEHTEYLVHHAQLGNIAVLAPRRANGGLDTLNKGDVAWIHWAPESALALRNV